MDIYTSYVKSIFSSIPEQWLLKDVIDKIRSGVYAKQIAEIAALNSNIESEAKRQKDLKENLPAFTPSLQVFGNNQLADNSQPNGIIQLEFDVKDNPDADFQVIRESITNIPEIIYCFQSPRGGLKFAIRTDFTKVKGDTIESLKDRYYQAYNYSKQHISKHVDAVFDDSLSTINQLCFVSDDDSAYFNSECEILKLNDDCIYEPIDYSPASNDPIPDEEIVELLKFIPEDYSFDDRRRINFAVFNCIGEAGIALLFKHWTTENRKKLLTDLKSQLKDTKYGNIGTLIKVAKKKGYKPPNGRAISPLRATSIDYEFEPLLSVDEGNDKLKQIVHSFFKNKKSTFINITTGFGKTQTALEILESMPFNTQTLYLVPTHKLGNEIKKRFNEIQSKLREGSSSPFQNYSKVNAQLGIVHIWGKKTKCHNRFLINELENAGTSIPSGYCINSCWHYHHYRQNCDYIEQFNGWWNIRIMTHNEYLNEQSMWFYGNDLTGGSFPKKRKSKPDYIIVDEDWLERGDCVASITSDISCITDIIYDVVKGSELSDAIKRYDIDVLLSYDDDSWYQHPDFDDNNVEKYIADSKNEKIRQDEYEILKAFRNYILSGDESTIKQIEVDIKTKKLHYYRMKQIADRHKDIPTLFLDATANESVVKSIIGDVDYHSIKIKSNDEINIYQAENFNLTKGELTKEHIRKQVVDLLKRFKQEYNSVGFITYKNIKKTPDFDIELSKETGINLFGHFKDIRGSDKFKNVDCLVIIGRFQLPLDQIQNYTQAIFGKRIANDDSFIDAPIRMKDGSTMAMKNKIYDDNRLEMVKEHFCRAETLQAIGRARLIWGGKKDIYLLTKESMGGDVEITEFITREKLFNIDDRKYGDAIIALKNIGYCRNTPKELQANLGLSKSQVKNDKDGIKSEFLDAGIQMFKVSYKDKDRHKQNDKEHYVWSKQHLIEHIANTGGTGIECGEMAK